MVRKPVENITEIIGQTPVVKLRHQAGEDAADIYVKLEYQKSWWLSERPYCASDD